jgi:hypothetical protein
MSPENLNQQVLPAKSPPRSHGTPDGYRNIRVLTSKSLHYRISAYAALSMITLNEFVVKWLSLATPLDPHTGLPVPAESLTEAKGQGQSHAADVGQGKADGPSTPCITEGATPSPAADPGPSGRPLAAGGPGTAQLQGAVASSASNPGTDPASIRSSPTASLDRPDPGQGEADAEAKGHINA